MPRFMDYMVSTPGRGRLEVLSSEPQRAEIFYIPSREAIEALTGASIPSRIKLLDIDRSKSQLTILPINTRWNVETFLKPKYAQIRRLTLADRHFNELPINSHGLPSNEDEVMMLLEDLPASFIKDFEYGLGFTNDFRHLINSVEEITGASELLISSQHETGLIKNNDTFAISSEDFDDIRKTINRISNHGRTAMRTVKYASVHNLLALKIGLPEKDVAYGLSPIRQTLTQVANDGEAVLSKGVQSELIDAVSKHVISFVEEQPDKIIRLQRDFELVTLDRLIERFEANIGKSLKEQFWQKFLNENRFLLGITFGFPVIFVQDEPSVGGHKLSGAGDNSTDYLIKNSLTHNVAIIEIKKPTSPLLNKREYRQGIYSASGELSGAINQMIDQKHNLVSRFAQKKVDRGIFDIESYSIHCCLIIGKIPDTDAEKRSFEFFRGNSKDVDIVTFDEMLGKMITVKRFLEGDHIENEQI